MTDKNTIYCTFCGTSQHQVRKLIAGPSVFICDECVELCMDILNADGSHSPKSVDVIVAAIKRLTDQLAAMKTGEPVENADAENSATGKAAWDIYVTREMFPISGDGTRAYKQLSYYQFKDVPFTLGETAQLTEKAYLRLPNLGRKTLDVTKQMLAKYGMAFGEVPPEWIPPHER